MIRISSHRSPASLGLLLLVTACGESGHPPTAEGSTAQPTGPPWFREVARDAGLDFRHWVARERHMYIPETVTGGAALLDYDGDGDLDVYLVQGGDLTLETGAGNRLYRNLGGLRFEDVTAEARVGDAGYGIGCAVADVDGNGAPDLYVTNVGPNVLYLNNGDGTFRDASAGVDHPGHGSSCAFGDIDGDGDPDLYVANYVMWSEESEVECKLGNGQRDYCSPLAYQSPEPDVLYENQGDGTFVDVSEERGLRAAVGTGLGVVFADFDSDGSQDVYVANDGMANLLWSNDGTGRFENVASAAGCALNRNGAAEAGMGVGVLDIDVDGDPDLFMTHLRAETNTLYENRGKTFRDVTALSGLAAPSRDSTGFGLGFHDFDHDGRLDLYVANGRVNLNARVLVEEDPYAEPNQLFRGVGNGRFEEVLPRGGTTPLLQHASRAAAFGDLDDDGDIDVVVNNSHGPAYLLENVAADGAWIRFDVRERDGRHAIGARLELGEGEGKQVRSVERSYSYCASSDPRVHFGLGAANDVGELRVRWIDGSTHTFAGPFAVGRTHRLERGE